MFNRMTPGTAASVLLVLITNVLCIKYEPDQVLWNLNQNETATDPLDYWGEWPNHSESIPTGTSHADRKQHSIRHQKIGGSLGIR